jgi:hypothetical protein
MIIPAEPAAAFAFYRDTITKCLSTRSERRAHYNALRMYYLYGVDPAQAEGPVYNKIFPSIDQIASFMYSHETTRFTIELGESVSTDTKIGETRKIPAMKYALAKEWNASNTDIVFGSSILWAFALGSMFIKAIPGNRGSILPGVVDPDDFGVLREDVMGLHNQEAFTHSYLITKSQLTNELEMGEHKRKAEILERVSGSPRLSSQADGGMWDRIVVTAVSPNIVGSLRGGMWTNLSQMVRAKVSEPLIEMHELYVYDDACDDYRLVTLAGPEEIVWDRPLERAFLKHESPFVQICPSPNPHYFYGDSEVERLIPLQEKLNKRMWQIDHLLELQAKPPKTMSGFSSPVDEMALTFDSPNGLIATDMPGAKADVHQPVIPENLYREVHEIIDQFEDMIGLTNVNLGKGEAGVRSQGHASQLSRLGSSRIKKRALVVEDAIEKLATLYLQLKRRFDKRRMRAVDGEEFVAAQFTEDFIAKVDAHSNSPIFMEDQTALAFKLFEVKAIDRDELLDLVEVPMRELLKERLKSKIEPQEAAAAAEEHKLEERKLALHMGGKK